MSASPAPSVDSQAPTKAQEQITFRFCSECSNMLYPKEDRNTSKLMFACRTCQFSEEAQSSCVFRNNMYNTVGETAGVTQDVGSDPTVGDPSALLCCILCGAEIPDECLRDEDVGGKMCGRKNKNVEELVVTVSDFTRMSQTEEDDEEEGEGAQ